jgi:hypothetical protein
MRTLQTPASTRKAEFLPALNFLKAAIVGE